VFERVAGLGRRLIWLHSFGERFGGEALPEGRARCLAPPIGAITQFTFDSNAARLELGGGAFGDVSSEVWGFSVSGLKVVRSWLGYVSVLDHIVPRWDAALTRELLELLWVLEATLAIQPELDALLDDVVRGPKLAL
jgi:hypothetical protein